MTTTLLSDIQTYWHEHQLGVRKRGLLVAVSGGVDSVVLLHSLVALGSSLGLSRLLVCYVDHGLRPEETPEELAWVKALAERYGLPFVGLQIEVEAFRGSVQDGARRARREALETLMKRESLDAIATGHHADDQAETVMLRLLRGTGVRGLAGIWPEQGCWVHPLLCVTRAQIESFARKSALTWLEDPTNRTLRYRRNHLRRQLIPHIEEVHQPRFRAHLCRLAGLVRQDEDWFSQALSAQWQAPLVRAVAGGLCLCLRTWRTLPIPLQRRALQRLIREACAHDVELRHLEEITRIAESDQGEQEASLPQGIRVIRSYGELWVAPPEAACWQVASPFSTTVTGPGSWDTPLGTLHVTAGIASQPPALVQTYGGVFVEDMEALPWPWCVRNRRAGDVIVQHAGSKRLKRWLIEKKIVQRQRASIPLVSCGETLLWIVGWTVDPRYCCFFAATQNTASDADPTEDTVVSSSDVSEGWWLCFVPSLAIPSRSR